MSVIEEYEKIIREGGDKQKESVELSTKAQIDQLAENRKLVEAEKQNSFRGAYVDYAKNINPYGVQSELAYGSGLGGAGKGETAQANYYNSYQNRLGEINTNVTGQLRDIAQQEAAARLAGEQAKLDIDTTINSQLAAEKLNDDRIAEGYAREDKANAYNQLVTAITSAGYTPTDEELLAAGMPRQMADAYKTAYNQQLAASYASSSSSLGAKEYSTISDDLQEALRLARQSGNWTEYNAIVNDLEALGNYDPLNIQYLRGFAPVDTDDWDQGQWTAYFKGIYEAEGADAASALLKEYINGGTIPQEYVSKASAAANGMLG